MHRKLGTYSVERRVERIPSLSGKKLRGNKIDHWWFVIAFPAGSKQHSARYPVGGVAQPGNGSCLPLSHFILRFI